MAWTIEVWLWLDGELLGAHEGAFGGPTFDITAQWFLAKSMS